jgi:hypothetical protein
MGGAHELIVPGLSADKSPYFLLEDLDFIHSINRGSKAKPPLPFVLKRRRADTFCWLLQYLFVFWRGTNRRGGTFSTTLARMHSMRSSLALFPNHMAALEAGLSVTLRSLLDKLTLCDQRRSEVGPRKLIKSAVPKELR